MKIETLPINSVFPYPKNPRDHSFDQIKKIALSITNYGFAQPIVIDEANFILVGHGRYKAAHSLQLKEIPCVKVLGLNESQKTAYRILDNKIQNESSWNIFNLETELSALKDSGFDFDMFGLNELVALLGDPVEDVNRNTEWQGMPEFKHGDLAPFHSITVFLTSEDHLPALSKLLDQPLTTDTKSVWYPRLERESVKGKAYIPQ